MFTYKYNKLVNTYQLSEEINKSQITIALDYIESVSDNITIYFKSNLSIEETIILDSIVNSHIPRENIDQPMIVKLDNLTPLEKAIKVQLSPLEGSNPALFSPNLCDKTTWYNDSIKITKGVLTTADNTKYSSNNKFWVDLEHGKVPYEDRLVSSGNYKVIVYIDDSQVTSGFNVDYSDGSITFDSQQSGSVTATYWYATSFTYAIKPISGKILRLYGTQIKATKDITWPDNQKIEFQVYVNNIPYGEPTIYKNINNMFITASEVASHHNGTHEFNILQYKYPTAKDLDSTIGAEIKIKLTNAEQFGGSYAFISADAISITK